MDVLGEAAPLVGLGVLLVLAGAAMVRGSRRNARPGEVVAWLFAAGVVLGATMVAFAIVMGAPQ